LISTASRQRLQKLFEHGLRCVEKNDYDYATQLFSQCVSEDPGNVLYLQHLLATLSSKFGDNKTGSRFSGLRIKSCRTSLIKSTGRGDWNTAFESGCKALAINPWDTGTLLALADACKELGHNECELYYLRWALDATPKDPTVNRQIAFTLQRLGQFDQAIACWTRVVQANPEDFEARQAMTQLSVEKTISDGGYGTGSVQQGNDDGSQPADSVATHSREARSLGPAHDEPVLPLEQRLRATLESNPAEIEPYLQLSDLLVSERRFPEAEQVLEKASHVAGGGDLQIRERQEDARMRQAWHQLAIAEKRQQSQPNEESTALVNQLRRETNQIELEIYAKRVERNPQNQRLKFELGLRLKRAGKFKDAIPMLQAARSDSKRASEVFVELGECFQRIEQYKLALNHYEQAIHAGEDQNSETRKLALYRAGVLATGLRELDLAERYLSILAGLDYSYRDTADRLDKVAHLRDIG